MTSHPGVYHHPMAESDVLLFPDSVDTVAVSGGMFDPPTRAHVELPIAAVDAIGADWLLVIPAAASPFKPDGAHATDEQRLRMLELAFADHPRVTVTPIELGRGGTSYTVDTLRDLRRRFPQMTFRLIIGADQATSFHRWREARVIIELAQPAVMLRRANASANADADVDTDADQLIESMTPNWSAEELNGWRSRIVNVPTLDASSTEARALLASQTTDERRLHELLIPEVLDYIRCEGLYGASQSR